MGALYKPQGRTSLCFLYLYSQMPWAMQIKREFDLFKEQLASLVAQTVKNLPAVQETQVQSQGWEYTPGEGNGNPLQYSFLENPMDRGAWQATVHGFAKNRT